MMKLSTIASICLAAAASAPSRSRFANAALCSELISDAEVLRLAAVAANTAYEEKSFELDACQASTPAPIPPTPAPVLPPTPSPTLPATPAPIVPPTPTPVLPATPAPTLPATLAPTAAATESDGRFEIVQGQSWNYNLDTPVNIEDVDVDVYFIDMDDAQEIINTLHGNSKGVVCYISIGTWEEWRDDADDFPEEAIGSAVGGWPGEKWLDINNDQVRTIMAARVAKAGGMGCDAIEPDNSMVYTESGTGVVVSESEQVAYNIWFAEEVRSYGMSVGLKNSVEIAGDLVSHFDFALNEECHEWEECDVYTATFLAADKAVFNVEYNLGKTMCESANAMGLNTIVKDYDLKAPFCSCVDDSRDFECAGLL